MRKLIFAAFCALGLAALSAPAAAQGVTRLCTPIYNANKGAMSCPEVGQTGPGNGTNPLPVVAAPVTATGTYSAATVGSSDSTVLAAATAKVFLDLVNDSATATVCINLGTTATITGTQCAAGEITLPPLWHRSWEGNFVPTDAVHAIASAAATQVAVGAK